MPTQPPEETLSDKDNTVVVLRLVTTQDGHLLHGEILNAQGEPHGRFTGWDGLVRRLKLFLATAGPSRPP